MFRGLLELHLTSHQPLHLRHLPLQVAVVTVIVVGPPDKQPPSPRVRSRPGPIFTDGDRVIISNSLRVIINSLLRHFWIHKWKPDLRSKAESLCETGRCDCGYFFNYLSRRSLFQTLRRLWVSVQRQSDTTGWSHHLCSFYLYLYFYLSDFLSHSSDDTICVLFL